MKVWSRWSRIAALVSILGVLAFAAPARAQFGPNAGAPPPKLNPHTDAPFDPSGYWVAVVTEDWRYRMVTPDKGDFPGVPINAEGRKMAMEWDPAKDQASGNACKSYGAGAIMRVPERLHITWVNDETLRVETDAGEQTRIFHFDETKQASGPPTWQGYSVADWEGMRPRGFVVPVAAGAPGAHPAAAPKEEGYMKVITTRVRPGYVRKNGVPYSANTTVEEYFDSFEERDVTWLIVTTIVHDPEYLAQPYITSSQFKKQPDAAGWNPTSCEAK
jgi:hypothetical protein